MKSKQYIGIDIGGTKIAAALVSDSGKLIARKKIATPADASPEQICECVEDIIGQFLTNEACERDILKGIGIGVPGIVDRDQQTIHAAPNIRLANFPLGQQLQKRFNLQVLLGNDVNLGLLGEKWLGVAKGAENVVGIFLGTGLGGAIIINGKLVLGARGAAAELGHTIIDLNGPESNVGINGTLESFLGRWAIERDIRMAIEHGEKTIVTQLQEGDFFRIKSRVLKEALRQQDKVVVEIMERFCNILGKACVSVNHFLNPEMIVLGGGVMEACGDFILPRIKKAVKDDPFFAQFNCCKVVESRLGDDAVVLGGVALVRMSAASKDMLRGCFYPTISCKNGSGVEIDNKIFKRDVYVRADGKVKRFDMDLGSDVARVSNKIGVEELRRVCKKHPDILIIGSSRKPPLELTQEAQDFLKTENVQYQFLIKEDAVDLYSKTDARKAILICQGA